MTEKKFYEYLKERLVKNKKTYIFLDGIQNVPKFEKTVDSLYINKKCSNGSGESYRGLLWYSDTTYWSVRNNGST